MSDSKKELCPYCKNKDLSILNEKNRVRHINKCKQNKPNKSLTQSKLKFPSKLGQTKCTNTKEDQGDSGKITARPSSNVPLVKTNHDDEKAQSDDWDKTNNLIPNVQDTSKEGYGGTAICDNSTYLISNSNILDVNGEISNLVCLGYNPPIENLFENFPFQLLPTVPNIILSNSAFHHKTCANGHFNLQSDSSESINKLCSSLGSYGNFIAILERASQSFQQLSPFMNNTFLTHKQLKEKANILHKEKNSLQIDLLRSSMKVGKLNSVMDMNKRFMVLLSENNIPRLKELVSVALKNKRSLNYIIDKVMNAIDGIYNARPSNDDIDLAFIVLKIGGRSLLSILCKANKLPSVSTAYRMAKQLKSLVCPISSTAGECMKNNLDIPYFQSSYSSTLKMDETFLTPRLRYNSKSNDIQGVCYQHGSAFDLQFNNFEDLNLVSEGIRNEECHVPKECLVVGVNRIDCKSKFNVLLAWPSCSKDDYEGTFRIISESCATYKSLTGKPLMSLGTDGDPARRIVMHQYCKEEVSKESKLYNIVSKIPLLDLFCGPNEETVSYDPKHLVKRCWCSMINETVKLNGVTIYNNDLQQLLSLVEGNSLVVDNLVKPGDKQNVPNATKFMLRFISAVREENNTLPYRLQSQKGELILLSYVFEALLSFYVFTDASISCQIKSFSEGAHCLLYLYLKNKSSILPNQLVHDIQATLQDAIFCCSKAKIYFPNSPLYLVRNGTDPAETFFGIVRAKNKNCNMDSLEFIHCASALSQVDHIIMNKHSEWSKTKGILSRRLCLDYSSIEQWDKDKLILSNVDIVGSFKLGKLKVSAMILEFGLEDLDFETLSKEGITFMKPFKKIIGVTDSNSDWSIENPRDLDAITEFGENSHNEADDINLGDFIAGKYDATIDIDGQHVYKATCVKEAFSSHPLSKDRLKRVRTMTSPSSVAPSKFLYVGDPVVVTKSTNLLANIKGIKSANKSIKYIDMNLLESDNLQFQLQKLVLVEKNEKFFWTGNFEGDIFTVTGKDCIPIQPDIYLEMAAGDCTPYAFDKQLVLDIGVHLQRQPSDTMVSINPSSSVRNYGKRNKENIDVSALHPCYLCHKKITLDKMRGHIALHIVLEEAQDVCGFCGREGSSCNTTLKKSSHRANKVFYEVKSECSYYHAYKRVPDDITKTHHCTNKLMHCPERNCSCVIWKYNSTHHYKIKHPGITIPSIFIVSDEEKKKVKKMFVLK